MVPIKTMANEKTNIVLSGDPKQLGPIIWSKVTRDILQERNLRAGYLERLMDCDMYNPSQYQGIRYSVFASSLALMLIVAQYGETRPKLQVARKHLEEAQRVLLRRRVASVRRSRSQ